MPDPRHAYLDLTVLPAVRPLVLSSGAGLVLDPADARVMWANGAGAALLGARSMKALLSGDHAMNPAMRRQIMGAMARLDDEDRVDSVMRVRAGFRTRVIGFNLTPVNLPDGARAALLRTEPLSARGTSEAEQARRLVDSLDGYGHASAILDGAGQVVAQSEHFGELSIEPALLRALVEEVETEADSLVKRPVETSRGPMPMGLARISDTPLHAVMIVAQSDDEDGSRDGASDAIAEGGATSAAAVALDLETDSPGATDTAEPVAQERAVGAFSNRRAASASRWYYRAPGATAAADPQAGGEGDRGQDGDADTDAAEPMDEARPDRDDATAHDATLNDAAPDDAALAAGPRERPDEDEARNAAPAMRMEQTGREAPEQAANSIEDPSPETPTGTGTTGTGTTGTGTTGTGTIGAGAIVAAGTLAAAGLVQSVVAGSSEASDATDAVGAADGEDEAAASTPADDGGDEARLLVQDGAAVVTGDGDVPGTDGGDETASEGGFTFETSSRPVRFVWEVDAAGVFQRVSGDLARTVGARSADIVGRTWTDVAASHDLDPEGEIAALLEKGDTWSGKTVLWPVDDTDMRVPTDLAGLPAYGRDRAFAGFNGFGILRTADAVVHEGTSDEGTGAHDTAAAPQPDGTEDISEEGAADDKVVDLDARRERALSSGEREAFSEIGDTLRKRRDGDGGDGDGADEDGGATDGVQGAADGDRTATEEDRPDAPFTPSAFIRAGSPSARYGRGGAGEEGSPSPEPAHGAPADAPAQDGDAGDPAPGGVRVPSHDVDTSILARLPIPVLVYRTDELLFGNPDFFAVTGYDDLHDLARAGGVDALFGAEGSAAGVVHGRDGERLDLSAHLQSVPWDDDKAMLLTLREGGEDDGGDTPDGRGNEAHPDATPCDEAGADKAISDGTGSEGDGPAPTRSETDRPNGEGNAGRADAGGQGPEGRPGQPSLRLVAPALDPAANDPGERAGRSPRTAQDGLSRLQSEDLRAILDTATDGVVVVDSQAGVIAMNGPAEALFDTDAAQACRGTLADLMAPESRQAIEDYARSVLDPKAGSLVNDGREVIGRTAEGGLIPLFVTMGRLERSPGACAVLRDLTQWRKAEEELVTARANAEAASASKSQFLAQVSHEIRTPLNSIIGFCDLMIDERFGAIESERYRGYLRDIKRSGSHVLELVNDLLDISKIEAGRMELDFDACDLNGIVSETTALSQPDANKQRVIIRTSLSAMVPQVVADPRSLRQIVLNLVTNSVRHTKQGGQVIVSTVYEESGEVVLRVRDTGVGMSEVELKRALEPFRQVRRAAERVREGTGLGLPLTKALVEANRAGFHIESVPDEGTLVEIRFPARRVLAER